MLNSLVLPDRTAEYHTIARITGGLAQGGAAKADGLRRDQNALRIHAVQNVFEAPALLANPILDRHRQRLDEQLIGVDGAAAHLGDFTHVDMIAIKRRVEEAQSFRFLLDLFGRGGAREDQDRKSVV